MLRSRTFSLVALVMAIVARASEPLPPPPPSEYVTDRTGVLSAIIRGKGGVGAIQQ